MGESARSNATLFASRIDDSVDADPSLLSRDDVQRLKHMNGTKRTAEFACGRSLVRRALEMWTGRPASSHRLRTLASGQLICDEGPPISLSHSGEWVVCAVAPAGKIGVDIQQHRGNLRARDIAKSYFSADETAWLADQPLASFYELWTLKEA